MAPKAGSVDIGRMRARIEEANHDFQQRRRLAAARRGVRVSVIIPVFNAMPYLRQLLTSLDDQGLAQDQLQPVIVDDGSTDGSAEALDAFASTHPSAIVIHQANSGWPGQPRNRALGHAVGRWVFFADADDYLAPNALRDLADFGDLQDAQVVFPRVCRCGTRSGGRPFTTTLESVTKKQAYRNFTPHKLVRRDLIEQHQLRFPEGKVRLEDGIFFSRCYLLADRMSALADRDLYFLRGRDDGGNISSQRIEPEPYVASLERIAQNVYELSRGPKMTRALLAEVMRRKIFKIYVPGRFPRYPAALQDRWIAAHQGFLDKHLTDDIREALSPGNTELADLLLARNRADLLAGIADIAAREDPIAGQVDTPAAPVVAG
ncbi:glycosyltransferase [Microlunatus elymi]|uniref:Glycosyltransferase n=1 Tax=Microlunatus elymi TaxID=2596828 RepID=A0A516PZE7_9ACTN|nr:glycosyltransferase [Microlunatus elymi]QDP96553.1 glycosyltransferase [Microlunatus elymi]